MLRILPRIIILEILLVYALALVGLTGVFMLLGVAVEGMRSGVDPLSLLRLLPYLALPSLPYTAPVCLLLSCTLVLGRMSGSNEIIALKASGVSATRILWPVLALSVLSSGVCLYLADRVVPLCQRTVRNAIVSDVESTLYAYLRQNHGIQHPNLPYELYADGVDGTRLVRPIIKRRKKGGGFDLVVQAREATLRAATNPETLESEMVVSLVDGVLTTGEDNTAYFQERTERMPIPEMFRTATAYSTADQTSAELRRHRERCVREAAAMRVEMSRNALMGAMSGDLHLATSARRQFDPMIQIREHFAYRADCETQQRIARSFAPIPFLLVGVPLSILLRQREMLRTFFLCFLPIIAVYWPSVLLATNVLRETQSRQWGLLWLPSLAMCLAAAPLIRRMIRY